jgi:hypothetical protein
MKEGGLRSIISYMPAPLNIRFAAEADADAITRLAQLNSRRPPRGPVLVAEVGKSIWAAISLDNSHAVSDPRKPTGDLVWTLAQRAREVKRAARGHMDLLPRVWPYSPEDELLAA